MRCLSSFPTKAYFKIVDDRYCIAFVISFGEACQLLTSNSFRDSRKYCFSMFSLDR